MFELRDMQAKLRSLANEIADNAEDAAHEIAGAQNEIDRSLALTVKRIDELALAQADEDARHSSVLAGLRDQASQAMKDHVLCLSGAATTSRALASRLTPGEATPRPRLAAGE